MRMSTCAARCTVTGRGGMPLGNQEREAVEHEIDGPRPTRGTGRARHASLTPRQEQIMALVVCGLLNKQIAAELGIREITVKAHRGRAMPKMQVASLADLVKVAEALDSRSSRTPDTKVLTNTIV
jgi:DNA-binding NarL/FixJ family response regulator